MTIRSLFFFALFSAACIAPAASAGTPPDPKLLLVVVVARDGVHAPSDYPAVTPYSARKWPAWSVSPGTLTPHGALLATLMGAYYRSFYAGVGLFEPAGCGSAGRISIWAAADPRSVSTASALLDGLEPGCGLTLPAASPDTASIFDPLPALGKADPSLAVAALGGATGGDPKGVFDADRASYSQLDALLDCASGACKHLAALPTSIVVNPDSGLASLRGPLDVAAAAVDDLQLEYVEGLPGSEVGWGHLDRRTLLAISQLSVLRRALEERNPYAARVTASNLTAHVLATLNQRATAKRNTVTPAPLQSSFVAFVGHPGNLAGIGGLLRLSWHVPGYQPDDTPPGGALIFELYDRDPGGSPSTPYVLAFFAAQPPDAMRRATPASAVVPVLRVPVFIPGCPALRCPIGAFNAVVQAAVDTAFVSGS